MTDETDDEAVEFVMDAPESRVEVYEWTAPNGKGGIYLFPGGAEQWAKDNGVGLLHLDRTTGVITAQVAMGELFHPIDRKPSKLASIK